MLDIIEVAIWAICACFIFLGFTVLLYLQKFPLKESIGIGLLAAIFLTGLAFLEDYLPYHIAIIVFGIIMSLLIFLIIRYLEKKSLKESIIESLIAGVFLTIIVLIVGKSVKFLL